jgi:exosortase B
MNAALLFVPAALLALYAPAFAALWQGPWRSAQSQGPVLLAVAIWLGVSLWRRHAADPAWRAEPSPHTGWPLLVLGAAMYTLGRSQDFAALEIGSLVPVLLGCTLVLYGAALARRLAFVYVFLLFLVPLPGSLVDALTLPLKIAVSHAADTLLHAAGYPVAREGVVLVAGPYRLLVADACAGLNSMFVLEAFGLLYLHLVRHASAWRNVAMTLLVVPVSFAANVVRVVVLVLVTVHFGDEAGQGFVHQFSGLVLLACALLLLAGCDSLLRGALAWRRRAALARGGRMNADLIAGSQGLPPAVPRRVPRSRSSLAVAGLLALAAALVPLLRPAPGPSTAAPSIESALPERFGDWQQVPWPGPPDANVRRHDAPDFDNPYDQVAMRAYANGRGAVIALVVAWGASQRQEVKIHRPELCYAAQGYEVIGLQPAAVGRVPGHRMLVRSGAGGLEAVSWWIRIGSLYSRGAVATRLHILEEGLRGRVPDGVLVRASLAVGSAADAPAAQAELASFLGDFVAAVPAPARALLVR